MESLQTNISKVTKRCWCPVLPNKQAFLDRWSKLKVFCFPGETACPNSGIRDMLHDSETHCLILRKAVWVWDSLPGLETYCLRVERCEIKKACSVSRQLYPRSWLLISSKQACGKIASCLWSLRAKTQTDATHLVILPEFDVKNLVPTIYHLNYACNLTIYDIECEVLVRTSAIAVVAKHCWPSVISDKNKLWTDYNMSLSLGHIVYRSEIE